MTIAATRPSRLFVSTAHDMFLSDDLGDTWHPVGTKDKWPLPYARGMAVKPDDPGVLYAGCGETTTGERGYVLRTTDFGQRWETLPFPAPANATIWGLATHPADANRIVRSPCSARCMSVRMQAGPGARSRVTSVRSGPRSGCQTNCWRSGRDGQPRLVKMVHSGGVSAYDLRLFVVRRPGQDLRQDLPRLGKR
jgi:hypothetical protein